MGQKSIIILPDWGMVSDEVVEGVEQGGSGGLRGRRGCEVIRKSTLLGRQRSA
jgi:hypothetical protein